MQLRFEIRIVPKRGALIKIKNQTKLDKSLSDTHTHTNTKEQMRATFWTLAVIIAATTSLTDALNINNSNAAPAGLS